jgi:hypothetical protein
MIPAPATNSNRALRESLQEVKPARNTVYRTIQPIRNRNLRRMEKADGINLDYFQSHALDKFLHLDDTHDIEDPFGILP